MANKEQHLMEELARLRQQVAELEAERLSPKQAQDEALRESEGKFRILAETTTAAIFIYQDRQNCYVNPATEAITGYTESELLAMNFWDIIHPDFRELVKRRGLARQQGKAIPSQYPVKILTKSGQERWLDVTTGLIEFRGRPAGLGTAFDITERKQAEIEIIRRNVELLSLQYVGATIAASLDLDFILNTFTKEVVNLLEVESCAILTWDQTGDLITVMAEYGLSGHSPVRLAHSLNGFPLIQRVLAGRRAHQVTLSHADKDPADLAFLQQIEMEALLLLPMESRSQIVGLVEVMDTRPERVFTYAEIALAQMLANQAATAIENAQLYAQAQQEIRERTQAEQELRQSEAKNKALLDAIPDLMFRMTREGQYLDYHPGKNWSYPLSAQEWKGKNVRDLLPADLAALTLDHIGEALKSGTVQVFEYRWQYLHSSYDYELRLVVSGPDEVLGIVRNITERKKMEEQAIHAERLTMLGRLSAALTHEINNPLQSMQTHLDLMLDFPLEPGEDKKFLQIMRQEVERLNGITRRILNLASPQPIQRRQVLVVDLLQEVLLLVGKHLQQHKIQVTRNLQEVFPVLAVPDQLTQVFLNLVINAIEALPEYGHLHLAIYPDQDQVVISFTNNGPAIPPDVLPHIFEPFFTTKPEGTGLGLWISYNLIQQHGGVFTVENLESDQGVVFTIKLPAVSASELNNDQFR